MNDDEDNDDNIIDADVDDDDDDDGCGTVPTFNSCTKCVGSPRIIHDCTSDCHPVFWAWLHG